MNANVSRGLQYKRILKVHVCAIMLHVKLPSYVMVLFVMKRRTEVTVAKEFLELFYIMFKISYLVEKIEHHVFYQR